MPARPRDNARETRKRIPTKVIANLEDLIAIFTDEVPPTLAEMLHWIEAERAEADRKFDDRRKAALGRLSLLIVQLQQDLMRAERKIRDARHGDYRDK